MSEQILNARYTDEQYNTVVALLQNDAGEVYEEFIEVDELEYSRYKQLGFTPEGLEEGTIEWKKAYVREQKEVAKNFAKETYEKELSSLKEQSMALLVSTKLAEERLANVNSLLKSAGAKIDLGTLPAFLTTVIGFVEANNQDKTTATELAKQLEVEYTGQTVVELLNTIK